MFLIARHYRRVNFYVVRRTLRRLPARQIVADKLPRFRLPFQALGALGFVDTFRERKRKRYRESGNGYDCGGCF